MAGGAPAGKKSPAKRPAKKAAARPAPAPAEQSAPAPAAAEAPVVEPLNRWLHGLVDTPRRIEVFDRWWEFKQPTGGRADAWDVLVASPGGVEAALASMLFDATPLDEKAAPGTARAREFLALAHHWVPPAAFAEFWVRFETAVFDPGGASAS